MSPGNDERRPGEGGGSSNDSGRLQDAIYQAADREYEHRGLQRRVAVRRLRLRDGLPRDLGGYPHNPYAADRQERARAAWTHLHALGLMSELSDRILREVA